MTATGIVTSTTRPFNPDIGDRIFETDTGRILYYYGSYLQWLTQWGATKLLGYAEGTGPVSTGSDALTLTIPYSVIQGRQIYWVANFPTNNISGVTAVYQLTDESNTVLNNRQQSVSTAAALQNSVTIAHREFIPTNQITDVVRKLRVIAGTIPGGSTFNLFCFDESFGISLEGHLSVWDAAVWDSVDQWGT